MNNYLGKFGKSYLFATGLFGTVLFSPLAVAQIVPDDTLGAESSVVTPQQLRDLIEGGAIRGENLFHSFSVFNITKGQQVYFANPDNITNILTRVTGNDISEIFGTLGVDGSANLFLLNPNGIVFGEDASLDVAGSFLATTAESLIFNDGEFNASNPDAPPLLTVNFTPGLQYGSNSGVIDNQGVLEVGDGQNLSLFGQKVSHSGSLIAPGGFIEVSGTEIDFTGMVDTRAVNGSVGTFLLDPKNILIQEGETTSGESISQTLVNSNVVLQADNDITVDDDITSLSDNNLTFQAGRSLFILDNRTIFLTGGNFTTKFNDENALAGDRDAGIASFTMNSTSAIITNGGDVNIEAGGFSDISQISMATDSQIITGNAAGDGGDITLTASGDITTGFLASGFINDPNIALSVNDLVQINTLPGTNNAGDINVNSSNSAIASTNFVLANALGEAGDINFNAAGNLTFTAPGEVTRIGDVSSVGRIPGEINLVSGEILLTDDVSIHSRILGEGKANGIFLTGKSISIEHSEITTITRDEFPGELVRLQNAVGGDIEVKATEDLIVRNSQINSRVEFGDSNVFIDNNGINVIGEFGIAGAGDIKINARNLKIIKDAPQPAFFENFSGILTAGDGDITINTSESIELIGNLPGVFVVNSFEDLIFTGGAIINPRSSPVKTSGNLALDTKRLVVRDGSFISTLPLAGEGGNITIDAQEILVRGKANIDTATFDLNAGDLTISSDRINLIDGGFLATSSLGSGNAGNFTLLVGELVVGENSSLSTNSFNSGNGGILNIEADSIVLTGGSETNIPTDVNNIRSNGIYANSLGTGNAGTINIQSDRLSINQGREISTATINGGSGGDIAIDTGILELNNGRINASTATASPGGNITIRATEFVDVAGAGFDLLLENIVNPAFTGTIGFENFTQGIYTITAGEGAAGNVSIETPNFSLSNGGLISTTTLGAGEGGNINIDAGNTINLENSLLATGTFTDAASGDINLNANQLNATGGAQAITTTFGAGKAGNLTVNVTDEINLIDPTETGIASGLFASSYLTASGTGGDISITTGELNITDGAAVSVSGEGEGNAGDIIIDAASVFLDNGSIIAQSNSGEGGNITLQIADNLILANNSQISTRAGTANTGGGDGGNINITADFIIADPTANSDITANAFAGNGGNINITTQQLFGLEFRPELTSFSDITASSQFGIDGAIEIEILEFDPANSLVRLPETLNDPSNQIVAGCPADKGANFTVTGRGGLPPNPRQSVAEEIILQAFETGRDNGELRSPTTENAQPAIIEAQNWIVNEQGKVELVASSTNNRNIRQKNLNCDR